ncbi:MAG: hypothetical protein GF311_01770 [Candidatus Lokiarchaeota archaeon]|nr:hypothetical protein [Candidatus Lokiarchaeota archaeon]
MIISLENNNKFSLSFILYGKEQIEPYDSNEKKRVIKLKDPKLRKIRKNLREILLKVLSQMINEILDKKKEIRRDPDLTYYQKQEKQIELESIIQDFKLAKSKAHSHALLVNELTSTSYIILCLKHGFARSAINLIAEGTQTGIRNFL